jgi:hypothetical protein
LLQLASVRDYFSTKKERLMSWEFCLSSGFAEHSCFPFRRKSRISPF